MVGRLLAHLSDTEKYMGRVENFSVCKFIFYCNSGDIFNKKRMHVKERL